LWTLFAILSLIAFSGITAQSDSEFDIDFSLEETPEKLVTVEALFSRTSAAAGQTYAGVLVVEVAEGWHINSSKPKQEWLIPAQLESESSAILSATKYNYPRASTVEMLGERMSVYDGKVNIFFQVSIAGSATAGEYQLPLVFTCQACNDKECRAPESIETSLTVVVGEEGSATHTELFGKVADEPEAGESASVLQDNELQRLIDKHGFWGYILALGLAFVTGLLLSFSPCTYPMIPITVSIFAGQERSLGRGFFLSLFYVGSMAAIYGLMGLVVASVGGVFGAWLASPAVVIGIAVVFVIFSLSMFGLYELQVPSWLRQKLGAKASGGGAGIGSCILLGVIAALVVSPCVGPFVAGILLYIATAGSPLLGFLILFVFALGLGALYMILATFSSAIGKLPKSGTWMESVKRFFGFVLLLMAIYFLRTILPTSTTALLTALLLLAFGVFGGGLDRLSAESTFFPRLKKFLGVLAFLVGIYLLLGMMISQGFILEPASRWLGNVGTVGATEDHQLIPWGTDLETGLTRAESEGKPVLIDTWATWCVNCKVLEKKTFGNPTVASAAERFVPIKVQLEKSDTPITKDFMQRFGLRHYSLPTTLLIDSRGQVRKIMQGVVGPEEMIAEMEKVS
jgi:thiol:disulfide interchange protein DsbD